MQWIEITIDTTPEEIDELCMKLDDCGISGLIIENEEDIRNFLEENKAYWDYIDEELERSIKGVCRVKFYLENSEMGFMRLGYLRGQLGSLKLHMRPVSDEDWENNWKQYYKPIEVGSRLLIVPEWEKVEDSGGRIVLRLDPGLIFGTGSHPTTQMCLEALEMIAGPGKNILDLGCGSGILSIAGMLLGTDNAIGCDIDEKAPKVALENAKLNGIDEEHISFFTCDVVNDSEAFEELAVNKYEIITANIVADVIIALAPKVEELLTEDGLFICSGIIEGRQNEVLESLINSGLVVIGEYQKDGWYAYACCKMFA